MKITKFLFLSALTFLCTNAAAAPKVVGDNSEEVKKHAALKSEAEAYVKKLDAEVSRIVKDINGQKEIDSAVQSKKMIALQKEGDKFGAMFQSPLSYCNAAGISAQLFWSRFASGADSKELNSAYKNYKNELKECKQQIASSPEATITIETAPSEKKPPFPGCMSIVTWGDDSEPNKWTCPKNKVKL